MYTLTRMGQANGALAPFAKNHVSVFWNISRVFLLCQLCIVNYYVKSSSNNLNENINTGVSVVVKTKRELKCQNELFLKYHFSGNTSLSVLITDFFLKNF